MTDEHVPGGCILLARAIEDGWVWLEVHADTLKVWLHLLISASHTNKAGVKRGQLQTSLRKIIKECKLKRDHKVVNDWLGRMEKRGMIKVEKGHSKVTLITIVNYERYQSIKNYKGHSKVTAKSQLPEEIPLTDGVVGVCKNERMEEQRKNKDSTVEEGTHYAQTLGVLTDWDALSEHPTHSQTIPRFARELVDLYEGVDVPYELRRAIAKFDDLPVAGRNGKSPKDWVRSWMDIEKKRPDEKKEDSPEEWRRKIHELAAKRKEGAG